MPGVRRSQRVVLSCTDCVRRKARCSKTIPCSSCVDRGHPETCHRESVQVVKRTQRSSRGGPTSTHSEPSSKIARSPTSRTAQRRASSIHNSPHSIANPNAALVHDGLASNLKSVTEVTAGSSNLTNEAVVTLEFLTHGRQNILSQHGALDKRPVAAASPAMPLMFLDSEPDIFTTTNATWETILFIENARRLLDFHQQTLAWMHNVVHMPTFKQQFENSVQGGSRPETGWITLYYAILCTTFYHAPGEELTNLGITFAASTDLARDLFDKAIKTLYEANFMAEHSLFCVQAICVLLQVAHNLDQSDLITVLVASAIRISQCLNLHRLGPDPSTLDRENGQAKAMNEQDLIDREVKKRVWWFLIRQDWLQIPFQNTYLVHKTQFNTPMPLNCHEDVEVMIEDGAIVVQPDEVYTQSSYTNPLNKIAVTIWQHQDRMHDVGHPGNTNDGLLKNYDEAVWADKELKSIFEAMPEFLTMHSQDTIQQPGWPSFSKEMSSVTLLSMAHKILTVHRHFQLQSFHDRRFSFTQLSCLSIAERCILNVETWDHGPATHIISRMWTVVTHLITCCNILMLASIFRKQNTLLYDASKMRHLAQVGRRVIRDLESSTSIARRGGKLLDLLYDLDDAVTSDPNVRLDIGEIVRKVSGDESAGLNNSIMDDIMFTFGLGDFDMECEFTRRQNSFWTE